MEVPSGLVKYLAVRLHFPKTKFEAGRGKMMSAQKVIKSTRSAPTRVLPQEMLGRQSPSFPKVSYFLT